MGKENATLESGDAVRTYSHDDARQCSIDASLVGELEWHQSPFLERKPPHLADLDVPPHFSSLPILHFNARHNTDSRHPEHPPPRPPQTRRRTRLHRRRFERHVPQSFETVELVETYARAPPEIIEATRF